MYVMLIDYIVINSRTHIALRVLPTIKFVTRDEKKCITSNLEVVCYGAQERDVVSSCRSRVVDDIVQPILAQSDASALPSRWLTVLSTYNLGTSLLHNLLHLFQLLDEAP